MIFLYEKLVKLTKKKIKNYYKLTSEENKIEKYIFYSFEYTFFFLLGCLFFYKKDWLYDLSLICEKKLTLKIFIYYYLYIIRYIVQLNMLNPKEKDYLSMKVHHISTISLLGLSFINYHRLGVLIGIVHDFSDIFLNIAKACNKIYEFRNIKVCDYLSYIFFIIFLVSYFITRIIFNSWIINFLKNTRVYIDNKFILFNNYTYDLLDGHMLFILLFVNLSVQIYFQIIICKFTYNLITSNDDPEDELDGETYFKKKT